MDNKYNHKDGTYGSYTIKPLGNYDVPTGWPSKPYKRPYGGTPGAPVMYQKPSDPDETGAGYGYSNTEGLAENDIYFYHSDHLGSTSYITDRDGNSVQYIAYKPFGETLIDEHAVSYDSPWKFNGKEWDSETGLYYYGARYYEPTLAIWYGVDALAEKCPNIGAYVYCFSNPVRLTDPDGNWPWENKNVRAARKYARKTGGNFQSWKGTNGLMYASVTNVSFDDEGGYAVSAHMFYPTKNNQHCALWNIIDEIDIPEGHADGALHGDITEQDKKVGFAMIGAVSGLMSLGATESLNPGTYVGAASVFNSLDDIFTNEQGESFLQQMFPEIKEEIGTAKNGITIIALGYDFYGIVNDSGQFLNIIDASVTSLSIAIDQVSQLKNEETYQ